MEQLEKRLMTYRLLALDLSLKSTGFSIFSEEGKLLHFGSINPKLYNNIRYPDRHVMIYRDILKEIETLIKNHNISEVVIEEINQGVKAARLGQKALSGLHYFVVAALFGKLKVLYMDSDGRTGWRSVLGLSFSKTELLENKKLRELNKLIKRGKKKLKTKKHLACEFVNKQFNMSFDVNKNKYDNDICDAIGLGYAFLKCKNGRK